MFFFDTLPWYNTIMWFVVFGILIGLNEFVRSSTWASGFMFMTVTVVLIPICYSIMWFVVFGIIIGLNELVRSSKWASVFMFMVVSVVLTPIWFSMGGSELTS